MENIGNEKNRVIEVMQHLDGWRKILNSSIPPLRKQLSNQIQAQIASLEIYERIVLPGIDEMMRHFNVSSLDKEILEDFMELRDLMTQQIYDFKRAIEADKNLVATFDKVIFWADKKL